MKRLAYLLSSAAVWMACTDDGAAPETATPEPEAQKAESLPASEIFGAETVSTSAPEFATSLTADGRTVYFNRASDDRSELIILTAQKLDGDTWSEPESVPFSDGTYRDIDPFVTEDGSHLFFSSNRPAPGETEADDFDLWVVDRETDGAWGEPRHLPHPINTDAAEIYSTVSRNGTLYFSSERDGDRYIYRARFVDGQYEAPEKLILGTEAESLGGNPAIAPDESFLVFVGADDGEHGGADLSVSLYRDGSWTSPRLLDKPINSRFADFAPAVGWDGGTLYWTSERPGIVPEGTVEGRPPGDLYSISWQP